MLSAATAHAHPSVDLAEPGARGGDVVHFAISGTEGHLTYDFQVGNEHVLHGTGDGGIVSGTFTMPDLGNAVRTVTVEAEIWASGKRKKVKRKLEYLGPALAVAGPPTPAPPAAVPAVVPQAASPPEPIHSPTAIQGTAPAPPGTPRSSRSPRQSRKRRAAEPERHVTRGGEGHRRAHRGRDRRNRDAATKGARAKRPLPRTAPLFDGIPEPGAGARHDAEGFVGLNAIAPRTAVLGATGARLGDRGGADIALLVPALVGLAALMLAGTVVLRRRRLASRRERD